MRKISAEEVADVLRTAAAAEFEKPANEQDWTTSILRALASTAPDGACIDPDVSAACRGTGRAAKEFLWDLTISSWPNYKDIPYAHPRYFEEATKRRLRLLLVAESEWGALRGRKKNSSAVMADFLKLLGALAPLKVMVFGYHPRVESTFEELAELMTRLIRASGDDADYLLFGVSWGKDHEYKEQHVGGGRAGPIHAGP
jgi:hypothetical protein